MSTHYIEEAERLADTVTIMSKGSAIATGPPHQLVREHAGSEVVEVYGPPPRLEQVERDAAGQGLRTRRTGTSVAVVGDRANGLFEADSAVARAANLEDVFVLLTGEEVE
jgi:lipooligosaccharide transport system ATP-binding protein